MYTDEDEGTMQQEYGDAIDVYAYDFAWNKAKYTAKPQQVKLFPKIQYF